MKFVFVICTILLAGCATTNDYQIYVEAQRSLSRDYTVAETARLAALTEMSKSTDPTVKATAIMLLQQLQAGTKTVVIEPPKNWLGF